jgi:predicted acetyltransferase
MLRIEAAGPQDAATLDNLFQLYFHELSDFLEEEVDEDGRFDAWDTRTFTTPGHGAYLLWMGEFIAGFLVIEVAQTPDGPMTEFADLFILRRYRRRGLAMQVLRSIMLPAQHPWLVAVFRQDTLALQFWRAAFKTLQADCKVREFDSLDQPDLHCFVVEKVPGRT